MPLRYSKDRLKILKSVAALQQRGALDETLYRDFLRRYGKALRQLLSKKKLRGPCELTKSWAEHFSSHQYSVEAEDLRTLIFEHDSDAYKALVRDAKIITPLI